MRLLFDENLSPGLAKALDEDFPASLHVRDAGLTGATGQEIWEFAKANAYAIVSKDLDFRERSHFSGIPPKVIWLDAGNSNTGEVFQLLRAARGRIERFDDDPDSSLLILTVDGISL